MSRRTRSILVSAALTAGLALALPGVAAGQPANASTAGQQVHATPAAPVGDTTAGGTTRFVGGCEGRHHSHQPSVTDLQSKT